MTLNKSDETAFSILNQLICPEIRPAEVRAALVKALAIHAAVISDGDAETMLEIHDLDIKGLDAAYERVLAVMLEMRKV